jgi:hypothetical protein
MCDWVVAYQKKADRDFVPAMDSFCRLLCEADLPSDGDLGERISRVLLCCASLSSLAGPRLTAEQLGFAPHSRDKIQGLPGFEGFLIR